MNSDISSASLRRRALILARELRRRRERDRLGAYRPYAKQREFHDAGAEHRERLFMAGNQLGKTVAGSFEISSPSPPTIIQRAGDGGWHACRSDVGGSRAR